ncbi:MAG: RHS repeat domain-containing protein [Pyrinomonadaceae bacterium]
MSYFYDNLPNAKGKLTKVSSSVSTTEYTAFDIMGRVTGHKQTTDGNAYTTGYAYNLSGALIEETYPSGRKVKNTLDANGDLAQVQSQKTSSDIYRNYANNFVYNAAGAVSSLRLGNGKFETTQYNSRLQPTQIGLGASASSQNLLKLNYDYGTTANNGNVLSQTITVPTVGSNNGFTALQTYNYDTLNRLKDATENTTPNGSSASQSWKQTFLYDRYGNRNFDTTANRTTTIPTGCAVAVCNPSVDPTTNKLVGYQFDNAGNTKVDANNQIFVYDSENKQVQVSNANGVVGNYFYDGDGKRIKKVVPNGETTIFVYDVTGKLVAEYSTVVASISQAKISYLSNDHLGSPRITTDAIGVVISRRDFMPFGEEIARANYGSDSIRQKFTGYERDDETGLDFAEARYFNSTFGRFSSPDDFRNDTMTVDPQSWNLYVYVRNNPFRFTDPNGEKAKVTSNCNQETNTCTINISASFAVYGASGQNVSQESSCQKLWK